MRQNHNNVHHYTADSMNYNYRQQQISHGSFLVNHNNGNKMKHSQIHSITLNHGHYPQYAQFHDNKMAMMSRQRTRHPSTQNTAHKPHKKESNVNWVDDADYKYNERISISTSIKAMIRTKAIHPFQDKIIQQLQQKQSVTSTFQLLGRYCWISRLSAGTFGEIWKAFDLNRKKVVAVKLIRNLNSMDEATRNRRRRAFIYEGKMIKMLNGIKTSHQMDIYGQQCIIKCHDIMHYGLNGVAISMELYGISLFDYLAQCRMYDKLLPISVIKTMTVQILTAINFIHGIGNMLHCDIKPENILFNYHEVTKQGKNIRLKICDFGNFIKYYQQLSTFNIQSEKYRSVEVFFGNKNHISSKIDIWSIGCILFELYTNQRLMEQKTDEYIVQMWRLFGSFPQSVYNNLYSLNYDNLYECWSMSDTDGIFTDQTPSTINTYQSIKNGRIAALQQKMTSFRNIKSEDAEFFDLLSCLLDPNPFTRYSSWDALKHPFLTGKPMSATIQNQKTKYVRCMSDDERNDVLIQEWWKYQCNLELFADKSSSSLLSSSSVNDEKPIQYMVKKDLLK